MKLFFDQNLSPRLVRTFADICPGSLHAREVGLQEADDAEIWEYAARHNLVIVSKDSDFHQKSFLLGQPPKVVWLRLGNCSTAEIEATLLHHLEDLIEFEQHPTAAFLVLG